MWITDEVHKLGVSTTPPVTVAGLSVAGVGMQDWVYILTCIWLGILITKAVASLFKRNKKDGR